MLVTGTLQMVAKFSFQRWIGPYVLAASDLESELATWLAAAGRTEDSYPIKGCKAIIAPHAGYAYSGPAAAWAYKSIDITGIKRVFILGPSHHFYHDGCAISSCKDYDTPIGKLPLDIETVEELRKTGHFESMSINADEAEHSIEMHLPYVRKVFAGQDIRIVPIVVGSISKQVEANIGTVLAPYLDRDDTIFIVSSDFCHWGTRFSYTYYYPEASPSDTPAVRLSRTVSPNPANPIYQSIQQLDHEAMDLLSLSPSSAEAAHVQFADYLVKTKNTICGRHPIGVLLGALGALERSRNIKPTLKWVRYEQSSACHTIRDSSVSYASAWIRF
ncbi:hypothetical protein H0H92_012670 [Tricholoma furcatifolium]|nr:hypothetical protein H0H92_012670 [Tricholoma furcatifolium]